MTRQQRLLLSVKRYSMLQPGGALAAEGGDSPRFEISKLASQVAEWVLADARAAWCQPEWQQRLASCAAFLDSYMPLHTSQQGAVEARPQHAHRTCCCCCIHIHRCCAMMPFVIGYHLCQQLIALQGVCMPMHEQSPYLQRRLTIKSYNTCEKRFSKNVQRGSTWAASGA